MFLNRAIFFYPYGPKGVDMRKWIWAGVFVVFSSWLLGSAYGQTAADADFSGNGEVDFTDFIQFAQAYGSADIRYDLNGDNQVDFTDFVRFARVYGQVVEQNLRITVEKNSVVPWEVVLLKVVGSANLADSTLTAVLGSTPATLVGVDEETLALTVPEVSPGDYVLAVHIGEDSAEVEIRIGQGVVVEDPAAYLSDLQVHSETALAELESRLGNFTDNQGAGETEQDLGLMRSWIDSARVALQQATEEEKRQVAHFMAANQAAWSGLAVAAKPVFLMADGDRVIPELSFRQFAAGLLIRSALLRITIGLVRPALVSGGLVGVVVSGAVVVQVYNLLVFLDQNLKRVYIQAERIVLDAVDQSQKPALFTDGNNDPVLFQSGVAQSFTLVSDYRRLNSKDANSGASAMGELISTQEKFVALWNKLMSLLPQRFQKKMPGLADGDGAATERYPTSLSYIRLEYDQEAYPNVTLKADTSNSSLNIALTAGPLARENQAVVFDVLYENPSVSSSVTSVSALVAVEVKPGNSISGRVTDTGTGAGIDSVVVELYSDVEYIATLTDSSGNFMFSGLEDSVYYLSALLDGFKVSPESREITLSGNSVDEQNFEGTDLGPVTLTGDLYIFTRGGVRKVDRDTGIITTVAGGGELSIREIDIAQVSPTSIELHPTGGFVDTAGNIFFSYSTAIFKIDSVTWQMGLIAGDLERFKGDLGDGASAVLANLSQTQGLFRDVFGNLYTIQNRSNSSNRIRKIDGNSGVITTVVGTREDVYLGDTPLGDGVQAKNVYMHPEDVSVDSLGNLFIAGDNYISRVDTRTGVLTIVAGSPHSNSKYFGDGGPATTAFVFGKGAGGYPSHRRGVQAQRRVGYEQ